jgi:glycosyltransferase involved in cell wall biosynthesis
MKLAFHTNVLCNRGTTVALLDYAKYNKLILNNESIIVYCSNFEDPSIPADSLTQPEIVDAVASRFELFGYTSKEELDQIIVDNNVDATYFIKGGFNDGLLTTKSKNLVHAVFQANQPHGDRYAYISEWLSTHMSNGEIDYVPHIVDLPKTAKTDYREKLGISKDKIVVGRIGGLHQFDIRWVLQTVANFAYNNPNYEFVFVNTAQFLNPSLPNIRFIDPIIDEQEKTDFILSCDAMIHARTDGESFGLAICEGLFHNKPVFAYNGGRDKHHIQLLEGTGLLYNSPEDLWIKLLNIKNNYPYEYSKLVEKFNPETVMGKFEQVFLT